MTSNHSNSKKHFFLHASPLLLVLFIDGMGLGLVFPILNALITQQNSGFFSGQISPFMHNFIFGGIIGVFMLCWFVGAAILGDLSDQIGRKKSLLICLIGSFIGYFLSAIAVFTHSLALLLLGRVIAGFTSGSQPIAQAAIVDISTEQDKARNIGFVLLALSLGFIFGPLLGGILSDNHLVSWFNFSVPFTFTAILSLMNVILLATLFKETFPAKGKVNIRLTQALTAITSAFKHEKVKHLSITFFIFILGWSSFYSFIALYLMKTYAFTQSQISIFMALMGVGFGLGNGFIVDFVTKRYSLIRIVLVTLILAAILSLVILTTSSALYSWVLVIPFASIVATTYAAMLALFSNQVSSEEQGWVMGITGAILAFVFGIDGIVVSMIATLNVKLPLLITMSMFMLATIFVYKRGRE